MIASPPSPRKQASLFFFEGHISVQPSVFGAAKALAMRGYDVWIYCAAPTIPVPPASFPDHIHVRDFTPASRKIFDPILRRLRSWALRKAGAGHHDGTGQTRARNLARAFTYLVEIPLFIRHCRKNYSKSDLAVAFDMTGLTALTYTVPREVPFVYWSLEIVLSSEIADPIHRFLKSVEQKQISRARAAVVQGTERRALLQSEHSTPLSQFVDVPNSPMEDSPTTVTTSFFRDRFGISSTTRIVLHAGMIGPAFLSLQIAEAASSWPDNFAMVFHERQKRTQEEPYIQSVQRAGGKNVFLSLEPVPFEEIDLIYAGAEIGLIAYDSTEANLATAWASSGKLAYYLRRKMPIVIVSQQCPSLFAEWRCGAWAATANDIAAALTEITNDYAAFSKRAHETFTALFDFNSGFEKLMQVIGR